MLIISWQDNRTHDRPSPVDALSPLRESDIDGYNASVVM